MKSSILLACLWVVAWALPAQAQTPGARMYKCVDAQGKAYYSDKMNPDCAQRTELNRQGVVMQKPEAAKPLKPAGVQAAPRSSHDQSRRDRALMATYTTEAEIDAARDRSLAIPLQGEKTVESKLEKASRQLTELKTQADALASQKKTLPASLLEEINGHQKKIATLETDLAQRKVQSGAIRLRYETDKQRFRELKGPVSAN